MQISTLRFGPLDIPEDNIISMPKPILGFEHLTRYCILEREDSEPFLWFQSVEDPAVAFIVVNPLFFYPEYRIEVNPKEIEELKVSDVRAVETYVIVTIPSDPRNMTANLQGPILINTETRLAKQMILVNSDYRVKHFIFGPADRITVDSETTVEVETPVTV